MDDKHTSDNGLAAASRNSNKADHTAGITNMDTLVAPTPFEQWAAEQEVCYKLAVEVNDEQVFASDYHSDEGLQEELRKPERAIAAYLQAEYDYQFKQGRWEEEE